MDLGLGWRVVWQESIGVEMGRLGFVFFGVVSICRFIWVVFSSWGDYMIMQMSCFCQSYVDILLVVFVSYVDM